MRICLVSHGFPPEERTGVETYTEALAVAFTAAGHEVEVFTQHPDASQADLALRRELRVEGFGVTRIAANQPARTPAEALDAPGIAARFGDWLDRERPDVVHFQHLIKLGLGLVDEVQKRDIPAVFTAHDYFGLCHRYTLMRPDLAVCKQPAEAGACARCDLATAVLNAVEGLGDYQMGVLPADLDGDARTRLVGVLDGDPVADGGFDAGEWQAAVERRAALDERRRGVFASFDLCLSPSAFLAEQLSVSGAGSVELLPYGIVTDDLEPLRRSAPAGRAAKLRVLFIGGLAKHKGVRVLLDAFELLEAEAPGVAELSVYGYSSDSVYVAALEARAAAVGATWCGAYARPELPSILAGADLVVVPSTWYENYPIAIREALAAGRPVVTSRHGALSESVTDGVDGRLFEPGDAADLAAVLLDFTRPGVVAEFAQRIAPVHTIEAQVDQLIERYRVVIEAAAERRVEREDFAGLPVSMRAFIERTADLERLPLRELFERSMAGLTALQDGLGLPGESQAVGAVLTRAFGAGSATQRSLRDTRREAEWLRDALEGAEVGAASQAEKVAWAERTLEDRDATIASLEARLVEAKRADEATSERARWLEQTLAGEKVARESLQAKADHLEQAVAGLEEQAEWLSGLRTGLEAERDELERVLGDRDELLAESACALGLSSEREASLLAGLEAERRERIELESVLRERLHQVAQVGLLALERQEHAMIQGLGPLFEALDRASGSRQDGAAASIVRGLDELVGAVEMALTRLGELEVELSWRRSEMRSASDQAGRPLAGMLLRRTGLGRRVTGWEQES